MENEEEGTMSYLSNSMNSPSSPILRLLIFSFLHIKLLFDLLQKPPLLLLF